MGLVKYRRNGIETEEYEEHPSEDCGAVVPGQILRCTGRFTTVVHDNSRPPHKWKQCDKCGRLIPA